MLVIKLGQYLIILGKLWMKKYRVILDISCDKFMFWLNHCQHINALENALKIEKVQHVLSLTIKDASNKENELNLIPITTTTTNFAFSKSKLQLQVIKSDDKIATNKYPELLPYILPKYKSVSKIVPLLKQILK